MKNSTSLLKIYWHEFKTDRINLLALSIIVLLILTAVLAPVIANNKPILIKMNDRYYFPALFDYPEIKIVDYKTVDYKKNNIDFTLFPIIKYSPTEHDFNLNIIPAPPSHQHWLGTDDSGRDVFVRLIYGTRISLTIGLVAVSIYVTIGIILGSLAGYFGGIPDIIISRLIENIQCLPVFFLILTILAFLPQSIYNIMIIIGLTGWTGIARLIRGEILKIRNLNYIIADRILGLPIRTIIIKHILPNVIPPVLVAVTFGIAGAILTESSLSFLGFGVPPPEPSWGEILSQAKNYVDFAYWLVIFPGLAIFITVNAYNLLGEAIRDSLDPKIMKK